MGARRSRPLVGIPGFVLFICMFVPAVRGCGSDVIIPISLPPVIPPYLLGLGFALAALFAGKKGGVKGPLIYLRVIVCVFLVESFIAVIEEPWFGLVVVIAPALMLAILGFKESAERRIAGAAIVCGVASAIWFGLWCSDKDALVGVWVSLVSSIGLVLGGIAWLADPADPDNEPDLPRARVISSPE